MQKRGTRQTQWWDMFAYLDESHGNINAMGKHVIGSFVAGLLFGVGLGGGTKSQYEGLDAETKQKWMHL